MWEAQEAGTAPGCHQPVVGDGGPWAVEAQEGSVSEFRDTCETWARSWLCPCQAVALERERAPIRDLSRRDCLVWSSLRCSEVESASSWLGLDLRN